MTRSTVVKGAVVAILWTLGAVMLVALLMQIQGYASIINDSGVVRGGTQRVVKMELAGSPSVATEERVSELLAHLIERENGRIYKNNDTLAFMEDLDAVARQWDLIENEIQALESGGGSRETLIALSEEHFALADEMVLSAQTRAEHDYLWMGVICFSLFFLAATVMAFMRSSQTAKLKAAYLTDPLTGLRNLIAFDEQAQALVSSAKESTYLVAYTNVSNFRYVNEAYGRDTGDKLIRALATMLESSCEQGEIVAHANADHFALLLHNEPQRPERLCEEVEEKLRVHPGLYYTGLLSFGCGICAVENDGDSVPDMLSNAIAVQKNAGRDSRVAYYDDAFRSEVKLKDRIAQHMDRAIENNEFLLYLQPKNDLVTRELVGVEALCRWDSPELGFLFPDSFIPVFEQNGFIAQLDFRMLELTCDAYPALRTINDTITASVNFSRVTVLHDGFAERLLRIVDERGIPRDRIEIEITESAFVVDEDTVIDKLSALKAVGFRLAMDDFGTGYSSLNLLIDLPIDVLKIDRSFLAERMDSERAYSVLKGVIDMASDLGLVTVCEGVETEEHIALLTELNCAVGQGYVFSKPLPLDDFLKHFAAAR